MVAALVEDGRPINAAVYAPVDDQLFLAEAGRGATLNGVTMRSSAGATLEGARVNGAKRRLETLATFVPSVEIIPRIASLALRLARVAEGRFDIVLQRRTEPGLGPCGLRPFGARSRRRADRP